MLAFHNDTKIKQKYMRRVNAHAKADEIIKGKYWEDGKGCAVGCTIHSSEHLRYETELGIPVMLARIEDCIFEGLPNKESVAWPSKFLKSITVGANLSLVGWKFKLWLQIENLENAEKQKMPTDVIDAIRNVITVLKPAAEGQQINTEAAWSAESAAWSAAQSAESAAWSAARSAESAAWSAAQSAAWSAAWSARSAARSAAQSAESAESAEYVKMASKLLELIKEAGE